MGFITYLLLLFIFISLIMFLRALVNQREAKQNKDLENHIKQAEAMRKLCEDEIKREQAFAKQREEWHKEGGIIKPLLYDATDPLPNAPVTYHRKHPQVISGIPRSFENEGKQWYQHYIYYDVNITGAEQLQNLEYKQQMWLLPDPDNADAVLFVDENKKPYGHAGSRQKMILDFLRREEFVTAFVCDTEIPQVNLAFYKDFPKNDYIIRDGKSVTLSSGSEGYQTNISLLDIVVGDMVVIEREFLSDKILVCLEGEPMNPLGTVSKEEYIGCDAYIKSIEETDAGKVKIAIAVMFDDDDDCPDE